MNPSMISLAVIWFPRLPFVLLARLVGLLGVLLVIALYILSLVWVYRDANRRGRNGFLVALLVALLFWPVSLLVWLVVRGQDDRKWREAVDGVFGSSTRITTLIWALLVGALVLSILLAEWTGMAVCIALAVVFKLALRGGLLQESTWKPTAVPPVIQSVIQPTAGPAECPQCGTRLATGAPQGLCPACLLKRGVATEAGPDAGERATFVPPPPEELAKHFPQLEILQFIGQGGMGAVYQARQPGLDRLVALKILPPQAARDPGFAERFTREARALAKLSHPNIVAIHDVGQAGEYYYFVMEYVDGTNLRQLERARKLAPREALAVVPQICDALQYAHDEGIVHRDIKPENILMDRRGRVKIADFGLAKLLGQERKDFTITESHHIIGTPLYMAPEQVEHPQDVDHRADIYSLGVVFYEMLTGELPIGRFPVPSSRMRGMQVDVRLDEVVLRALEKEPERRYQQASVLKTEVETIVATPPPVIGAPTASSRTEPPKGGTPTDAAAGPDGPRVVESSVGVSPVSPAPTQAGTPVPPTEILAAPQSPRLSRTATVGALWALLFFLAIVPTSIHAWTWSQRPPSEPSTLMLFLWIPLLLGVPAAFGSTILGCISLSQIRRSAGRLYGLSLALFDALLFPLLVLDALIGGVAVMGLQMGLQQVAPGGVIGTWTSHWWLALLAVVLIVLIDFLIVRAAWRAARRPIIGLPAAGAGGGAWKVVVLLVAVVLVILAIPVGAVLLAMVLPAYSRVQKRAYRAQATAVGETRPLDIARFYQSTVLGPNEADSPYGPILGYQVIDGLPFEIGGQMNFYGQSLARNSDAQLPSTVEGIEIGRRFDELHLIHFAKWPDVEGETIARIRLHYADGTESELPILYGGHVRDWQRPPSEEKELLTDPDSKIFWRGPGFPVMKSTTRLFKSTLANPWPQKVVESMEVVSAQNLAAYVLAAATVANRDPQRPLTPARAADEPERDFVGSLIIHVVDQASGEPLGGALVETRMTVDDVDVPASPCRTSPAGEGIVRYPLGRTSSISASVQRQGYASQATSWKSDIPGSFTFRLAPGE